MDKACTVLSGGIEDLLVAAPAPPLLKNSTQDCLGGNAMSSLAGKVALVAGGTRGGGRGIAAELGAAGATVYVTGRTTRTQQSEYQRPETIEETAELVTSLGGKGVAVRVD